MGNKLLVYFLIFFLPGWFQAQTDLSQQLTKWLDDPIFKHAGIGVSVLDANSGKPVLEHHPQLSLIPASALKLLTTSSALAILGPEFQFKTELYYTGQKLADGTLNGNVWIKGYGDPTLGSDEWEGGASLDVIMEKFRLAFQRQGIRKINGYIIADPSYFDVAVNAPAWQWNDLGNYYGAGSWGININENLYKLKFKQSPTLGATPGVVDVQPSIPGLVLENYVTSGPAGSGDNAYIFGAPYTFLRFIHGTIPAGSGYFTIKGSIPDPPLFAAQYLYAKFNEIGIIVEKGPVTHLNLQAEEQQKLTLENAKLVYQHLSPKLSEIVQAANLNSVNLYCESMLKAIGKSVSNNSSYESSIEAIKAYWINKNVDFSGCNLMDGSGLSPRNTVTAAFLSKLLQSVYSDKALHLLLEQSLPIAGKSGTLKNYLKNSSAAGKIWAKTGSMDKVRAIAGFAISQSGQKLVFTVIINNYDAKASEIKNKLEQFLNLVYQY